MFFYDISNFSNTEDYLPLFNAALITDLIVLLRVALGQIQSKSLTEWYKKYGLAAVLADVLSILIGIIIARFIYPYFYNKFSLFSFLIVVVAVQWIHDLSFAKLFNSISTGKSAIIDTFKDYAKEFGIVILFADSAMMISTVLLGSLLATLDTNTNIIILVIFAYILPYLLYSVPQN
jgi:hypothetical protein